jgi:hypothetical protein
MEKLKKILRRLRSNRKKNSPIKFLALHLDWFTRPPPRLKLRRK